MACPLLTPLTQFAEHPGPTNPNRQFATSGSTCGMVDNTKQAATLSNNYTGTDCAVSIFEALSKKNVTWKNVSFLCHLFQHLSFRYHLLT